MRPLRGLLLALGLLFVLVTFARAVPAAPPATSGDGGIDEGGTPPGAPPTPDAGDVPAAPDAGTADESWRPATITHFENPTYPPEAKVKGIDGAVVLRLTVDTHGAVTEAQVVSSPDPTLAAAAQAAAMKFTFAPAMHGTVPQASFVRYTLDFHIEGEKADVRAPATASDAGTASDGGAPPQEVTVYGTPNTPTGATVAVVSQKDIQSLPAGDSQVLSDVIATQAGVVRDVYGLELFHIHGLEYGIAYYIDGIPIMYGAGESFADVVPTRLVESVNLYTGGMPLEYGANGGVLDLVTRRPGDKPEGDVQILYGTFNTVQPSARYAQSFGNVDVLVGGNYFTSQYGLSAPQFNPIVHDAETAGAAFGKVDYRASTHDRFEVIAQWQAHNYQIPIDTTIEPLSEGPPGAIRQNDSYGNAPPVFIPYNANPTEQEQDLFSAASYVHTAEGQKLQVSPYFRYSTIDLNCDPGGWLGPTSDPGTTCTNLNRQVLHEGANATYGWQVGENQHWKVGLFADDAQESLNFSMFTRSDAPSGGPDPSQTVTGNDNINILQAAAFLQDEIAVGRATFFPGVRVDLENAGYGGANVSDLLLLGPSAKLGFSYAITDRFLLHASAGYISANPQTLDVPVVAQAFGLTTSIPAGDALKTEKDEQADLGLTYRIPGRFKVNLTAWGRYSQDVIDWNPVGPSAVLVNYNWSQGRAIGLDLSADGVVNKYLTAFGNVSPQLAEAEGVDSAQYLFTPSAVNYMGWGELDHTQFLTMNFGADLHDEGLSSHFSVLVQYGSGLRTGPDFNENLPAHCTLNATLRHKFESAPLHPEVAVDVLNAFNEAYPIRIADGYFGSAYGPPRRVNLRLIVPFGG